MGTKPTGTVNRYTSPDPQTNTALQGIQNQIASLSQPVGPGAGRYVLGPPATLGGTPPSITVDSQGRILSIQAAT